MKLTYFMKTSIILIVLRMNTISNFNVCNECKSKDLVYCNKYCPHYRNTLIFDNNILATLCFGLLLAWFLIVTKLIVVVMIVYVMLSVIGFPIGLLLDIYYDDDERFYSILYWILFVVGCALLFCIIKLSYGITFDF